MSALAALLAFALLVATRHAVARGLRRQPVPAGLAPEVRLEGLKLGHILVAAGHVTAPQVQEALATQRKSGRLIGEELVAAGHVAPHVIDEALGLQRRLLVGTLAACVAMAHPGVIAPAAAAQVAAQSVRFVIHVPPMVRMQFRKHPATLDLRAEDISRGYVEVPAASVVEVLANTPWEASFHAASGLVRSAKVSGLAADADVGPEGGSVANLVATKQATSFELSYRLELAPGLAPGSYPWPVSVSAHAI